MNLEKLKCEAIITECDKHIQRINSAFEKIKYLMPLDVDTYNKLTDDEVA